jgi:hypothetical protein
MVPSYRPKGQLWNGYYTILIRRGEAYRDFRARGGWSRILSDSASELVISEATQTVEFSSFDGLESVGIDDLEGRFDQMDPRLDPYMNRLMHFFEDSGEWSRVFVLSRTPVFRFFLRLLLAFPGYGRHWRLVDFDVYGKTLSLVLSAVFLVVLYFAKRESENRWVVALGYVPWFFSLLSGDFYDLLSFYLLYSAWYLVVDESLDISRQAAFFNWLSPDWERLRGRYIYMGIAFLLTTLLRMLFGQPARELLRNLAPLLAMLSLIGVYLWRVQIHWFTHDHLVFSPIRILSASRRNLRGGCLAGACALVVMTPFLLLIGGPTSSLDVPAPLPAAGSDSHSWKGLENLWRWRSKNQHQSYLPDIAEYVVHRAFQEGLPYGERYTFPTQGHRLTVSLFSEDRQNNRISRSFQVITTFDEQWLAKILEDPPKGSLERMFLDQGKPVLVRLRSVDSVLPGFSLWKCSVLLLFVFFILFSFDFLSVPMLIYSGKNQEKIINRKAA